MNRTPRKKTPPAARKQPARRSGPAPACAGCRTTDERRNLVGLDLASRGRASKRPRLVLCEVCATTAAVVARDRAGRPSFDQLGGALLEAIGWLRKIEDTARLDVSPTTLRESIRAQVDHAVLSICRALGSAPEATAPASPPASTETPHG